MKGHLWSRVEACYHAALELPEGARADLLAKADPQVRREVESLLLHEGDADEVLEQPVWKALDHTITFVLQQGSLRLCAPPAKPTQRRNSVWGAEYAPSSDPNVGYLLFVRGDTLMAQPFDNRKLELIDQPVPIVERLKDGRTFSVAANNVLVYQQQSLLELTWYDREGKALGTVGEPDDYRGIGISPDGTRASVVKGVSGQAPSIWLVDLLRGSSTRFSSGVNPVWSPDGNSVVFSSNKDGPFDLYRRVADGAKDAELLLKSDEDKYATSWSRDGRFLLYTSQDSKTRGDIWVLPMDGDKKPIPFLVTEFDERAAKFSPDGRWVAYVSDESGVNEVYVRPFSMNATRTAVEAGGKWLISYGFGNERGINPCWRGDGRELYYQSGFDSGHIIAVSIDTSPVFHAGVPHLIGLPRVESGWDVTEDGKRFLVVAPKSTRPDPYTVIVNWQAALKK